MKHATKRRLLECWGALCALALAGCGASGGPSGGPGGDAAIPAYMAGTLPEVTGLRAEAGDGAVTLSWDEMGGGAPPAGAAVEAVLVTRAYHRPAGPTDGIVVYDGRGTACTDAGLDNGREVHYAAFTRDAFLNASRGVHVSATPAASGEGTERRLESDPAGAAPSSEARIACAGERVYAIWRDERSGYPDILFRASPDGGRSWPRREVRVARSTPGAARAYNPRIACAGERVYAIWRDDREGAWAVYLNVSDDGGATWGERDQRLSAVGAIYDPLLACAGERVYVAWRDAGAGALYAISSGDGGARWTAPARLDGPRGIASSPCLACAGDLAAAAWVDERDGASGIYAAASRDGGASWDAAARLERGEPGARPPLAPALACAAGAIHVAWAGGRTDAAHIYGASSRDGGVTWGQDARLDRAPGATSASHPVLAAAGARIFVAWIDERAGRPDVYGNRSGDGGASWGAADLRLNASGGAATIGGLAIAAAGDLLGVAWHDDRNGAPDIFCARSRDGGARFQGDMRLDADLPGSAPSYLPQVAASADAIYAVWRDERAGAGDIFFDALR